MSKSPDQSEQQEDSDSAGSGQKPAEHSWVAALEEGIEEIKTQPAGVLFVDVLKIDLPYIVMLSMAVLGIGLVTFTGEPVDFYWELLTPVYCALCIYVGWRHTTTRHERGRLIWTQVLHWAAVLAAMALTYSDAMLKVVNPNAAGLMLMVILALSTFVAGVHAGTWQICVVGLILAGSAPVLATIQSSSPFIVVATLGVLIVFASLYFTLHAHRRETDKA